MRAPSPAYAIVLLLASACATKKPPPPRAAVAVVVAPPMPLGSARLPDTIACESEAAEPGDGPTGSLDKEAIKAVFRAHADELKACYDAARVTRPKTEGRVMARFAIAPSGAVEASCLVTSSLNDARVDQCVVDRLLTWRFPKPDGGGWVVVTYPFVFVR